MVTTAALVVLVIPVMEKKVSCAVVTTARLASLLSWYISAILVLKNGACVHAHANTGASIAYYNCYSLSEGCFSLPSTQWLIIREIEK